MFLEKWCTKAGEHDLLKLTNPLKVWSNRGLVSLASLLQFMDLPATFIDHAPMLKIKQADLVQAMLTKHVASPCLGATPVASASNVAALVRNALARYREIAEDPKMTASCLREAVSYLMVVLVPTFCIG